MLELQRIREQKDEMIELLKVRNFDGSEILNKVVELDELRRSTQQQLDNELAESNKIAKSIGGLFKEGKIEEANAMKEKAASLKTSANDLKDKLSLIHI